MTKLMLLAALACAACEVPPEAMPPAAPPPAPVAAEKPAAQAVPTKPADGVQLAVTEANGVEPTTMTNTYAPAREVLGHCPQAGGGTVHVRVQKQGASLHMKIEPGATLDPLAHRCVLEALSTIDLPDTGGNGGGPAVPPSGFTSLLTVTFR
jgi:hypothetical protein